MSPNENRFRSEFDVYFFLCDCTAIVQTKHLPKERQIKIWLQQQIKKSGNDKKMSNGEENTKKRKKRSEKRNETKNEVKKREKRRKKKKKREKKRKKSKRK